MVSTKGQRVGIGGGICKTIQAACMVSTKGQREGIGGGGRGICKNYISCLYGEYQSWQREGMGGRGICKTIQAACMVSTKGQREGIGGGGGEYVKTI